MEGLMVETSQVQQIMAVQLIRVYLLFLSFWNPFFYAYLRRDHECKYCYTNLELITYIKEMSCCAWKSKIKYKYQ